MSKRISLKKLGKKVKKFKSGGSVSGPTQVKGVVIGEKHPMEDPSCLPDKKGKAFDRPKTKQIQIG